MKYPEFSAQKFVESLNKDIPSTLEAQKDRIQHRWNREHFQYRMTFAALTFTVMLGIFLLGACGIVEERAMKVNRDFSENIRDVYWLAPLAFFALFRLMGLPSSNYEDDHYWLSRPVFESLRGKLRGMVRNPYSLTAQSIGWAAACNFMSYELTSWLVTSSGIKLEVLGLVGVFAMTTGFVGIFAAFWFSHVKSEIRTEMFAMTPLAQSDYCERFAQLVKQNPAVYLLPTVTREIYCADYLRAKELVEEHDIAAREQARVDACASLHSQVGGSKPALASQA